jgi:hypothetical protein
MKWQTSILNVYAHFKPGEVGELDIENQPSGSILAKIKPKAFLTSYFHAFELGAVWRKLATAKRADIEEIWENVRISDDCRDSKKSKTLLIAYGWLEKANRIRRRALALGGGDRALLEDVHEAIVSYTKLNSWEKRRACSFVCRQFHARRQRIRVR